jgi:hypothetical protein
MRIQGTWCSIKKFHNILTWLKMKKRYFKPQKVFFFSVPQKDWFHKEGCGLLKFCFWTKVKKLRILFWLQTRMFHLRSRSISATLSESRSASWWQQSSCPGCTIGLSSSGANVICKFMAVIYGGNITHITTACKYVNLIRSVLKGLVFIDSNIGPLV